MGEWPFIPFAQLLAEPVRNGIYKTKEFHGTGTKIVNMGELFGNPRLRAIPMKRLELTPSESDRFLLQNGDLIFARRSLTAEGAGKCSIVLDVDEPTTFESSIIRARPDKLQADSLFLYYIFRSPLGLYLLDTIKRQVAVAGITGNDLSNLAIPTPPIPEQKAIAAILGSLDDKIDLNRRMNETLEAMARAIFKDWFVDFGPTRAKMEGRAPYLAQEIWDLFPDALDDKGKPAGWMSCRIGEFAKIGRGASPRPINDYMGGDVPWVKISDATASTSPFIYKTKEFVTKKGSEKSVSRRSGSLILSNSATCGLPYFLGIDACIHDGWLYFDIEDDIQKYTLYFTLAHISEKLIGLADGSVQKNLNIDLVGSQSMIVPGALILDNFALCAKTFFNRIKNNDIESRTLAQTRDLLLPKLLSGEIRVKDAEKAVGAVL